MGTTSIRVPLNTMLADLDETVRRLLRREFTGRGFDGIEIAFDAPEPGVVGPALQPDGEPVPLRRAPVGGPQAHRLGDAHRPRTGAPGRPARRCASRPPTRSRRGRGRSRTSTGCCRRCWPSSTPTTRSPRTCSPAGSPTPANQPFPLRTRVAEPRQSGSPEFWSSIGGAYKASLDWSVILSCDSGATMERGPEVRVQTLRMRNTDGGRASVEDLHRLNGDGARRRGRAGPGGVGGDGRRAGLGGRRRGRPVHDRAGAARRPPPPRAGAGRAGGRGGGAGPRPGRPTWSWAARRPASASRARS